MFLLRFSSEKVIFTFLLLLPVLSAASPYKLLHVSVGRSCTLPCSGEPNKSVEWKFKQPKSSEWLPVAEFQILDFSPGSGFQGRVESFHAQMPGNYSLVLSPVMYSDRGIYECLYKNGHFISDIKLMVSVPSLVLIEVGRSTSLPCYGIIKKQASAADLDIHWQRDGEKVYRLYKNNITYGPGFENRTSISTEQALQGNLSLTISQTWFSDQGHYQCFFNNPKEYGNPESARLTVTDHSPHILTVKAGDLLSIPLHTTEPVRVTFSRPGINEVLMAFVSQSSAMYEDHCGQRCEFLAQNKTLLLRNVTLEDAGFYKVTDLETNMTISTVFLIVSGPSPRPSPGGSAGGPAELSAGAVISIVLGVLGVLGVAGFFGWKCHKKQQNHEGNVSYTAAMTGDPNDSSSRANAQSTLLPSSPELPLPVPETALPESGTVPTEPPLPESGTVSPEPHLSVTETEPSDQTSPGEKEPSHYAVRDLN